MRDICLRKRQGLTSSHPELQLHQVEACHSLRHWVLHLQPPVELVTSQASAPHQALR